MITRRGVLLGFGTGILSAKTEPGEFWNVKKPAQWSDKEIQRLLTRSPWAKEVAAAFDRDSMQGEPEDRSDIGGSGRGTSGTSGIGGGMGRTGGHGSRMETSPLEFKALVRWETALPVVEAARHQLPEAASGHYIVSVSGLPVMNRRGDWNGSRRHDPNDGAQMEEQLIQSTQLRRKGKDAIYPVRMALGQSEGAMFFFFPHGEYPIRVDDKEVTFRTHMGPLNLRVTFLLRDMIYNGQLAL